MTKHVLIYGLLGGILIALLRAIEYRYLTLEHSIEIYGGAVAILFVSLGIGLGLTLTRRRATVEIRKVTVVQDRLGRRFPGGSTERRGRWWTTVCSSGTSLPRH